MMMMMILLVTSILITAMPFVSLIHYVISYQCFSGWYSTTETSEPESTGSCKDASQPSCPDEVQAGRHWCSSVGESFIVELSNMASRQQEEGLGHVWFLLHALVACRALWSQLNSFISVMSPKEGIIEQSSGIIHGTMMNGSYNMCFYESISSLQCSSEINLIKITLRNIKNHFMCH